MTTPDPLRDELQTAAAIPADAIPRRHRPPRRIVAALLASRGKPVTVTETTVTEDVDGIPSGTTTTTTEAHLTVSLQSLGWTEAEWNDPRITE